jgi:hypothetical protein
MLFSLYVVKLSENLFEVVVLLYMYSCDHLKQSVLANRGKNYFIKLIASKEWLKFAVENYELLRMCLVRWDSIINLAYNMTGNCDRE